VNTASKEPVNWPARSLIRNLTEAARWPRSIKTLRAALCRPRAVRVGGAGADPGITQDLPHRGGSDRVTELHEFALHPLVPPGRVPVAMRMTSLRIVAAVDGRPGRRRLV